MSDLKQLSRAIIVAGLLIGLGMAAPAIIAATTQHQRYVLADRKSDVNYGPAVLDTRTGEICYPGPREPRDGRSSKWKEQGRKCDRIEIEQ